MFLHHNENEMIVCKVGPASPHYATEQNPILSFHSDGSFAYHYRGEYRRSAAQFLQRPFLEFSLHELRELCHKSLGEIWLLAPNL